MRMRDVNRRKIFAAPGDPIDEFLRMLRGQERIDKDSMVFAIDECDRIGHPSKMFLSGRQALRRVSALFGQQLPVEVRHRFLCDSGNRSSEPRVHRDRADVLSGVFAHAVDDTAPTHNTVRPQ